MSIPKPLIDFGHPAEPRRQTPSFGSVEEEAEWWDTLDSADYDNEPVPGGRVNAAGSRARIALQLDPDDRKELDRRSEGLGVEPSTLVHIWVEERLHREAS